MFCKKRLANKKNPASNATYCPNLPNRSNWGEIGLKIYIK